MNRTIRSRFPMSFSFAASLFVLAFASFGALAGGMPPEVELDANGVPVEASAAAAPANPTMPATMPAESVVLASESTGDAPRDASAAALAAPERPASGFDIMMRDHR